MISDGSEKIFIFPFSTYGEDLFKNDVFALKISLKFLRSNLDAKVLLNLPVSGLSIIALSIISCSVGGGGISDAAGGTAGGCGGGGGMLGGRGTVS